MHACGIEVLLTALEVLSESGLFEDRRDLLSSAHALLLPWAQCHPSLAHCADSLVYPACCHTAAGAAALLQAGLPDVWQQLQEWCCARQPPARAQQKVPCSKQDSQLARDQSVQNKAVCSAKKGTAKVRDGAVREGSPASTSSSQTRRKAAAEASGRQGRSSCSTTAKAASFEDRP